MLQKEQTCLIQNSKKEQCSVIVPRNIEDFVDINAQTSSWYLPKTTAEKSAEILDALAPGRFVIRKFRNSLILHLRENAASDSYLLKVEAGGLSFAGQDKVFPTLSSLVVHHSIMQEHLPTPLLIAENENTEEEMIDFIDIDVEPDFTDLISKLQKQIKF